MPDSSLEDLLGSSGHHEPRSRLMVTRRTQQVLKGRIWHEYSLLGIAVAPRLSSRSSTRAFEIKSSLKNHDCSDLVYHRSVCAMSTPRIAQCTVSTHGAHAFVYKVHVVLGFRLNWFEFREFCDELVSFLNCRAAFAAQQAGLADIESLGAKFGDESLELWGGFLARERVDWRRKEAVGVTAGDTDAGIAHVDADPHKSPRHHTRARSAAVIVSSATGTSDGSPPPP